MQESTRGIGMVTGVVLGVIGIGVLVTSATGSSTRGAMPNTVTARLVESTVVGTEKDYDVPSGSVARPTVSYVVTTAARAWGYLSSIKSESGYTNSGVVGPVMTTLPPPGVTTEPAPINLLTDPEPVALVELSGVPVYELVFNTGGPICVPGCTTLPPPPQTAVEADDAFVVVNLDNGALSGGEMATPAPGTSFSLLMFGTVTSWTGPRYFGKLPKRVSVEPVSAPAYNSGPGTSTAPTTGS